MATYAITVTLKSPGAGCAAAAVPNAVTAGDGSQFYVYTTGVPSAGTALSCDTFDYGAVDTGDGVIALYISGLAFQLVDIVANVWQSDPITLPIDVPAYVRALGTLVVDDGSGYPYAIPLDLVDIL